MKQAWLLFTAFGLFLFLGTAGAVETESISVIGLTLQLLAGGASLYIGSLLRKKAKRKAKAAAQQKAASNPSRAKAQPAVRPSRSYHRAA